MKLSTLLMHTAITLGREHSNLFSYARSLREKDVIRTGNKGPQSDKDMLSDREIAVFFLAVNGILSARASADEVKKWQERAPKLIEHIGSCIRNRPEDVDVEFDVDGYCARFMQGSRTRTFGERKRNTSAISESFLVRHIPAESFRNWTQGLVAT